MGNDGGSIPTRRELVKEAARNLTTTQLKEVQTEQQAYHWTTCPLSHQPLREPVVSDSSGKLYNKDAILEYLLPAEDGTVKSEGEHVLEGRVKSLKDVVEVKLEVDEEDLPSQKEAGSQAHRKWCDEPFTADNVIPILPVTALEKDRLLLRAQKLKEQGSSHSLKKATGSGKKRKKHGEKEVPMLVCKSDEPGNHESVRIEDVFQSQESRIVEIPLSRSGTSTPGAGIKNEATASLTAKVLSEEHEKKKRRKIAGNQNLQSLFSTDDGMPKKNGDFMTRGFAIPAGAKR